MATTWMSDDMIWEVRTTGLADNGAAWRDTGAPSTDYTQQDAPQWSQDGDLSSDATGLIYTSVAGGFTANMVGNTLHISGGNPVFITRWVEITGFIDANNITVKGTSGANKGTITGGDGRIGGALIEPRYAMQNATYGAKIHVKAGTYNASGSYSMLIGQAQNFIQLLGYNASRGDSPRDNDRPLFNMAGSSFLLASYTLSKHFRVSSTAANGLQASSYMALENVYVENTTAVATRNGMLFSNYSRIVDCEATCPNSAGGDGIAAGLGNLFLSCYVHHSDVGFNLTNPTGNTFLHNIIANCNVHGLYMSPSAASYNLKVLLNTFYDNAIDIEANRNVNAAFIWGNIFEDGTDGVTWFSDLGDAVQLDWNNFHGKAGNDVTNVTKGPNTSSYDPLFETPGSDFRLQNASDCRGRVPSIYLAVGL